MRLPLRLPVQVKAQQLLPIDATARDKKHMWKAAVDVVESMQALTAQASQLVHSTINGAAFVEWDHYPENDVRDSRHHTQYFYHAHPGKQRPFTEHGHFHYFVHAQELGLRPATTRYEEAPAHIVALSMDAQGIPSGFFIVNRWVTKGPWLSYRECERALAQFQVRSRTGSPQVNRFLSACLQLYRQPILELIAERDRVMQKLCAQRDRRSVFADTQIEVICYRPISLLKDIEALEKSL